jgi:hypothetical protein
MHINEIQLRRAIREMNPRSKLFHILKDELSYLGYWKNKPRGNPKAGYIKSKTKESMG